MVRTYTSWSAATAAALAILSVLSLDSHAWNLGRTPPITSSRPFTTPRKYRQLDLDDEHAVRAPITDNMSQKALRNALLNVSTKLRPVLNATLSATKEKVSPKTKSTLRPVHNVQELRKAVLDDGLELKQISLQQHDPLLSTTIELQELLNHDVLQLIQKRASTGSTPGKRLDNATLALSLEGGGMRGAVSAGMAAAIASLGLCDAFDAVYGSSAGSVVGAYMVSRQMCVDVYTQVLPAAQTLFVCKKRMAAGLVASLVNVMLKNNTAWGANTSPGMNISFVLDGIMDHDHGLRPLDLESFRVNDKVQPLRIATSSVKDGKLSIKCLGTRDFFPHVNGNTNQTVVPATVRQDGLREGLYACLEAGMTVPGATGPPVMLVDGKNTTEKCFDAFCFEPLPYRSAVEDGATHVLVLRSRPECFQAKTKPGVYELGVAPLYFRSHGEEQVARFFEKGGQQYIYLEDLLTLEEGRQAGIKNNHEDGRIHVPPTTILYGVEQDEHVQQLATNRDEWKKAHILPIIVPKGTPELSTLEQGQDAVLEAVRGGFAVAFDMLAPAAGVNLDKGMTGERVAQLVFPKQANQSSLAASLGEQVSVRGHLIGGTSGEKPKKKEPRKTNRKRLAFRNLGRRLSNPFRKKEITVPDMMMMMMMDDQVLVEEGERCHQRDAHDLLSLLPGIQNGNLPPLADGLHYCRALDTKDKLL